MSVMTQGGAGGNVEHSRGGGSSGLADVVALILDKGIVIDVFARVSLVGIEILTVDVRVVIASVDTYLKFAEAANRLDLYADGVKPKGLTDVVQDVTQAPAQGIAKGKTKGALEGAVEQIEDMVGGRREQEPEAAQRRQTEQ
ncbi:gas vesicle protein GvpJ [Geodermatophilus ruber]|uniref:Gas vesicle protein A n=1 Tax=Geodermatophilus ruber TaxID=504800 RepID=A0A1I4CH66_9ACTN|nr:gas vesicle protein GvpJ [Geodermatophilus ruber]SFK79456.1 Gas vesicle protein [Geodermatophilus ruber]